MYWFFSIVCLLFLAFNLEVIPGRPWHGRYTLIWKWNEYTLIRIFPQNIFVLVDGRIMYRYLGTLRDTYIPAIRLDTHMQKEILHYSYLMDWIQEPPIVKAYPPNLRNEIEILNYVTQKLKS